MKLIKIMPDKVQIKSNNDQLGAMSINSAILAVDEERDVSLVCVVTAITRNEEDVQFDNDGEPLEPEATSTIECSIIGSLVNGIFAKAVDLYPATNVKIKQISKELFESMISDGDAAGFKLGTYVNYDCDAYIDGNRFFQRHSAILGNTGSGKSFTVASILEKLSVLKSANIILFDLHGEYSGLSYVKKIKIGDGGLDFPMWFLSFKDIYGSLLKIKDETAQTQIAALRKTFYEARNSDKGEDIPIAFDLNAMISELTNENEDKVFSGEYYKTGDKAGMPKTTKGENNGKLTSVINLLKDKQIDKRYSFMNNPQPQRYLNEFISEIFDIKEKNVKVVDLSDVPSDMVPTIIAVTSKLVYRVQLQQDRKDLVPLCMICDEAHVYIPTSDFMLGASQRRLLDVFETIAKEGRKFGTSLMVISQRPSELNRTIMAQCANFVVLKMSNESDKEMIKSILPDGSKGMIDSVNLFRPGDCLVIGDSAKITFKIKIDLPSEQPSSSTIDTWDAWKEERSINTDQLVFKLLNE
ncbi:MAG: ATP-binding protein [Eubacteriales bacterium]|nr:ATP-binding protein [Eubacteriales bacterium]